MKKIVIALLFPLFLLSKPDEQLMRAILTHHKDPRIQAFLDTIAYAEGTYGNTNGYRMRFPGIYFQSFKDHPRKKECALVGNRYICATAAGRYMFLAKTWDVVAPLINAHDFSPTNQDRGALALIIKRKALSDILKGNITAAIYKLNRIWATFPEAPYNQPTKSLEQLQKIYKQQLKYHQHFAR